jgi:hypothetical protein
MKHYHPPGLCFPSIECNRAFVTVEVDDTMLAIIKGDRVDPTVQRHVYTLILWIMACGSNS